MKTNKEIRYLRERCDVCGARAQGLKRGVLCVLEPDGRYACIDGAVKGKGDSVLNKSCGRAKDAYSR